MSRIPKKGKLEQYFSDKFVENKGKYKFIFYDEFVRFSLVRRLLLKLERIQDISIFLLSY